jgi:uncharacterized protein
MITLAEGEYLVKLARRAISSKFTGEAVTRISAKKLNQKNGVFVTLHVREELRGCIGFPEPIYPLQEAVIEAAKAAAFEDPRFSPLSKDELARVKIEVSVLTKPELIEAKSPHEYLGKIRIGTDGLILRAKYGSGLLLPQVATEYNWTAEEFLKNLCRKAGLGQAAWKEPGCKIYRFQAQIFSEDAFGRIIEKKNG